MTCAFVQAILESVESDVFAQLGNLAANFSLPQTQPTGEEIFLSVLGSIGTVIGVLIPLTSVGVATTALYVHFGAYPSYQLNPSRKPCFRSKWTFYIQALF